MSKIFEIVENYLFRRNVCEVPTNALNKIFLTLNKEILRYDNTTDRYVDKFIYTLRSKKDSGRFPDDREFAEALATKQVYLMRGRYKSYLFERFENFGTVETKDVYTHLDHNDYSIEHIMPQHLTPAWIEALGANASEIHEDWVHRLANLTLTGYNPSLSNKSFQEKRDAEQGGYRSSGLRMNQKIAQKDSWGLPELEERNRQGISVFEKGTKRIMITGTPMAIPNWKLHHIVETSGAAVVCEEMCTGTRYFENLVEEGLTTLDEQYMALSKRYMKNNCACFTPNPGRVEDILRLAKEYQVDGVIDVNLKFCCLYDTEGYSVERALKEAGIPVLGIETDYDDGDSEQLRTRIGAFVEMLG